jgi:hypothetical protein
MFATSSEMKYKGSDICLCGHMNKDHDYRPTYRKNSICWGCAIADLSDVKTRYHPFKLDNLKLIEDLAEKRGL